MGRNQVCYWELASHDAGKSVDFFEKVFDWEMRLDERLGIHELPSGDPSGGFHGGGIFTLRKARRPFLTVYIQVDDIEERARRIEEAGGMLVEPPFELPTGSKICLFTEPSGVTFAMLQPAPKG